MLYLSSSIRDWTLIPWLGRQILSHWTIRKSPGSLGNFLEKSILSRCCHRLGSWEINSWDLRSRGWFEDDTMKDEGSRTMGTGWTVMQLQWRLRFQWRALELRRFFWVVPALKQGGLAWPFYNIHHTQIPSQALGMGIISREIISGKIALLKWE